QRQRRLSQGLQHHQETEKRLEAGQQQLTRTKHTADERKQQLTERQIRVRKAFSDASKSKVLERYYTHFRQTKTQANHAKGLDYQGPILGHSRGRSR
ncbi:hypothetical protein, partial [Limosilactobacillus reuteri]